jgi:lipopolysaccharide biosynthesis protein
MSKEKTNTTAENTKNLEQIAKELDQARTAKTDAKVDPCSEYKKIKPILQKALPFIRLIPKFGEQVADAIELVMGLADNFCP